MQCSATRIKPSAGQIGIDGPLHAQLMNRTLLLRFRWIDRRRGDRRWNLAPNCAICAIGLALRSPLRVVRLVLCRTTFISWLDIFSACGATVT